MLVKIKENILTTTSAGMPPIYIYRRNTNQIEEFVMKGMPLGAVDKFPYQSIETNLEKGDVVLLMSDGLPELFNEKKESFDDFRIKENLQQNAELPSSQIVLKLFQAADEWKGENQQNDDISFIVFKSI